MTKYDLLIESEQIKSIKTQNGKITSIKNSNFEKKGLRKFEGGQCYHFSYFGEISTSDLVRQSTVVPGTGIAHDFLASKIQSKSFSCQSASKLILESLETKLESIEGKIAPFQERFSLTGTYRLTCKRIQLIDDTGQSLEASNIECTHWYQIKRQGSASIMDAYFWNCSLNLSPEYAFDCLEATLTGFDRKAKLAPDRYPVLFAQQGDAEGAFLEKIKSSLKADKYYENAGILSGKLGIRYFNERLTIVDSNVNSAISIFSPFDREGFIRNQTTLPLIEDGVVKNVIADKRLAKKYKIAETGNGIRDFQSAVRVDFNSVEILPGTRSTQSILKSIPQCVVVMMGGGGEFTDIGDYSQPVEFSYLVEYGEVIGRLPAITVHSSVQKMFGNDLIEIASDNYFKSGASPSLFMKMDVLIN